jgi:aminopeptidase YwaD
VAGLLELARRLAAGQALRRSLLLVAFTAEEVGLVGSGRYVSEPPVPLENTVTMINLDMIGRLSDDTLTVFGAESADSFEDLVRESANGLDLELSFAEGAFGPSDQTSFHAQGLPVLFFFTGTHSDYHTPEDDAGRIDADGTARVVHLVERVAQGLADDPDRPAVLRSEAPARVAAGQRGYGPYLGTVPAFGGPPVRGVRLQAVRTGSPAEHAGLRNDDVIVQFTGAPVANLEEFAALLFGARAGERVEIVFERDGQRVETWAVLGQRR